MNEIWPDPQAVAYVESIPKEKRIFDTLTNSVDTLWGIYHKFYRECHLPLIHFSSSATSGVPKYRGWMNFIWSKEEYMRDVVVPTLLIIEWYISNWLMSVGILYADIYPINERDVQAFPSLAWSIWYNWYHLKDKKEFSPLQIKEILSEIRKMWIEILDYNFSTQDELSNTLYFFLNEHVLFCPSNQHIDFWIWTDEALEKFNKIH